jgi:hypothetical protein
MGFMETLLGDKLKKATKLSESLAWLEAFDQQLKNDIVSWIQKDQLQQGIDEDGDIIGLYSEWTEMLNPEKIAGTPYTLDDTGDFYRSMYVVVLKDSIVIEADPIKGNDNLFFKYGDGIIGLTEESMGKLQEEIRKKYIQFVKDALEID